MKDYNKKYSNVILLILTFKESLKSARRNQGEAFLNRTCVSEA